LVEEAAAAAQSLQDQATTLAGLVARFRIDASADHKVHVLQGQDVLPVRASTMANAVVTAARKTASARTPLPAPRLPDASRLPSAAKSSGRNSQRVPAGEDDGNWESF